MHAILNAIKTIHSQKKCASTLKGITSYFPHPVHNKNTKAHYFTVLFCVSTLHTTYYTVASTMLGNNVVLTLNLSLN